MQDDVDEIVESEVLVSAGEWRRRTCVDLLGDLATRAKAGHTIRSVQAKVVEFNAGEKFEILAGSAFGRRDFEWYGAIGGHGTTVELRCGLSVFRRRARVAFVQT